MSDLKRCPFCGNEKITVIHVDRKLKIDAAGCDVCKALWPADKADWNRRADDDWRPNREKIIEILIECRWYRDSVIADKIIEAMRPLPDPPLSLQSERKTIREWMPGCKPECRNPSYVRSMDADATDGQEGDAHDR